MTLRCEVGCGDHRKSVDLQPNKESANKNKQEPQEIDGQFPELIVSRTEVLWRHERQTKRHHKHKHYVRAHDSERKCGVRRRRICAHGLVKVEVGRKGAEPSDQESSKKNRPTHRSERQTVHDSMKSAEHDAAKEAPEHERFAAKLQVPIEEGDGHERQEKKRDRLESSDQPRRHMNLPLSLIVGPELITLP